jgi:resolvase-like protein
MTVGIRVQRRRTHRVEAHRLARSMKLLIETISALRVRGIGFRSLTEALDTTTAQGRLVFHLFRASGIRAQSDPGAHPSGPRCSSARGPHRRPPAEIHRRRHRGRQRRYWPTPTSASHKSRTASASRRRCSIGTSRPPNRECAGIWQRPLYPKDRAIQKGFSLSAGGGSARISFSNGSMDGGLIVNEIDAPRVSTFSARSCGT